MIELKPIESQLTDPMLAKGDKVIVIQDYLLDKGYKLLEIAKYMERVDWSIYK